MDDLRAPEIPDEDFFRWLREGNPINDREKLEELYHGRGLSYREIGEEYGLAVDAVRHMIHKHGIEPRTRDVDETLDDPRWLGDKYHGDGMTYREIAEIAGCSSPTVMRRMQEHGIEPRSPQERPAD